MCCIDILWFCVHVCYIDIFWFCVHVCCIDIFWFCVHVCCIDIFWFCVHVCCIDIFWFCVHVCCIDIFSPEVCVKDSNCTTFQLLGQQSCQRFFCLTVVLYMSQMTRGFIKVLFFHSSQLLAERYWFVLSWKSIHLLNLLLVSVSIKRQWDCRRQSGNDGNTLKLLTDDHLFK